MTQARLSMLLMYFPNVQRIKPAYKPIKSIKLYMTNLFLPDFNIDLAITMVSIKDMVNFSPPDIMKF